MPNATYAKKTVVVVEGKSSGASFAPALRGYGYQCVHVHDRTLDSSAFEGAFYAPDYEADIEFHGDTSAVVEQLKDFDVVAVVPGSETGAGYADQLIAGLGLPPGNDPEKSLARRDKFLMEEQLRQHNLRTPLTLKTKDAGRAAQFASQFGDKAVVKPVKSAGTQGVQYCNGAGEVKSAVASLLQEVDLFGQENTEVLVQELIEGPEYMVNSISVDGRHFVIEIWRVHKVSISNAPVYDYVELVDPSDDVLAIINPFVSKSLDALGIRNGPAHAEVMLADDGPVLIEIGARIMGVQDPYVSVLCTGASHLLRSVQLIATPELLLEQMEREPYRRRKYCLGLSLLNPSSGRCFAPINWDAIRGLESFVGMKIFIKEGDTVPASTDLLKTVGGVYLAGDDEAALRADYRKIRAMEAAGFYNIAV